MEGPGLPHERVHISMHALIQMHGKTTFTKLRGHSTLFRGRVKFDCQNPLGHILAE